MRFVNERPVFDAVYHAIKTALQKEDAPTVLQFRQEETAPKSFPKQDGGVQMQFRPAEKPVRPMTRPEEKDAPPQKTGSPWNYLLSKEAPPQPPVLRDSDAPAAPAWGKAVTDDSENAPAAPPVTPAPEKEVTAPDTPPVQESPAPKQSRFVGEIFKTYCILERDDDTIVFIDKHAAHERLLYEKLKAEADASAAQTLLEPVTVTLNKDEYGQVLESKELFLKAGFELDDFGEGTILVRSVPLLLEGADIASTVIEMAGYLCSHRTDLSTEHMDWIYHNVACRAAIKAGNHTEPEELIALAERLEDEDVRYCPHGRPVSVIMRKKDLEKQFGRIQ